MPKTMLTVGQLARWGTSAGALVLSGLLATVAFGQTSPSAHEAHHAKPDSQAKETQTTGPRCHEMMAAREKMMSDVTGMNAKLEELVKQMDAATGDAKVAATAAVVHELVAQRTRMVGMMTGMQPKIMGHMMEHMQAGMKGGHDAMADCPMMKAMSAPPESPEPGTQGQP